MFIRIIRGYLAVWCFQIHIEVCAIEFSRFRVRHTTDSWSLELVKHGRSLVNSQSMDPECWAVKERRVALLRDEEFSSFLMEGFWITSPLPSLEPVIPV